MWNINSPTNSNKLLIDNKSRDYGNTRKISVAMEIRIQNKCISA